MIKACPQCGSESSAAALSCVACGTVFQANEMNAPAEAPLADRTAPDSAPDSFRSERTLQIFELLLVCFIAFGGGLFLSTYILFAGKPPSEPMHGDEQQFKDLKCAL